MIVIYDRKTREIIGVSMISQDNSGLTGKPSMKNIIRAENINPNLMDFYVEDDITIANEIFKYELKFSSSGEPKQLVKKPHLPYVDLSIDARDHDGDGIPEMKADGRSKVTITASIRDEEGKIVTNASNEIHFLTTGGVLSDRTVKCKNGVAKTTLQSVKETLTPTITAFSEGIREGEIKVEFVHPDIKL
ncbi:Ig-like domain-containing protein [[Eubacterium] cellulosolvens]